MRERERERERGGDGEIALGKIFSWPAGAPNEVNMLHSITYSKHKRVQNGGKHFLSAQCYVHASRLVCHLVKNEAQLKVACVCVCVCVH